MAGRRLSPEEQDIWDKVTRSVAPLHPVQRSSPVAPLVPSKQVEGVGKAAPASRPAVAVVPAPPLPRARKTPAPILDDSWERRIANGALIPEMSIDLHGHNLESAHRRLNQTLDAAVTRGVRVLLIVTGNPRPVVATGPGRASRGAIRAEIGDWLALSGHAEAIASVRAAHPRHGGQGALYVILRRKK